MEQAMGSRKLRVDLNDTRSGCAACLRNCWHRVMTESGIIVVAPGTRKSYLDQQSTGLGPCYPLAKLLMFIFTALFWILGIVVFALGIAAHTDSDFRAAVSSHVPAANVGAGIFIFTGLAMVLTGFVGCLGAMRESRCLLFSFFLILFSVFILLVACGIWADASRTKLRAAIAAKLEHGLQNYYTDASSRKTMDSIQTKFQCCGSTEGALDYQKSQQPLSQSGPPASCGARTGPEDGCYFKIVAQMEGQLTKIAAIGVTIAFIMIIGMVLSLIICWHLQEGF